MRRDGADLHSDVTVSLSQALLGGTIRVPGVNDEIVFTVSQHRCSVQCRMLIGSHMFTAMLQSVSHKRCWVELYVYRALTMRLSSV